MVKHNIYPASKGKKPLISDLQKNPGHIISIVMDNLVSSIKKNVSLSSCTSSYASCALQVLVNNIFPEINSYNGMSKEKLAVIIPADIVLLNNKRSTKFSSVIKDFAD